MASIMENIKRLINMGASSALNDIEIIELELAKWKRSPARKAMIDGERYYLGQHDILNRKRTVISADGALAEVENLPNNRIVDNQYSKMVDQKVNYLCGKPLTLDTKKKEYQAALSDILGKHFARMLKNLAVDSLNGGVAWLHPYYGADGRLRFKRFAPYEVLPFWRDSEHTDLELAVRIYEVEAYEGRKERIIEKVEVYTKDGIARYTLEHGHLILDADAPTESYILADGQAYNWERIPLIPFKHNSKEMPLIKRVKSLQDGINTMLSDFENNMQEDSRNTILILVNYDGENLGEFRHNLATYGAVKVRNDGQGTGGDVRKLEVQVNAENYKAILDLFKKALIENARGYDAKDDRLSGNPNQMNIQSMYSDIDLDANGMETEYQASFEDLLWFINNHLVNTGKGDFSSEDLTIIFNRDILINESESIDGCQKSVGILSTETIISQHPWVSDVEKELERLQKEKQEAMSQAQEYIDAFGGEPGDEE